MKEYTELKSLLEKISNKAAIANEDQLTKAFDDIAITLLSKSILALRDTTFFIQEIEFYFWSNWHEDPYVHASRKRTITHPQGTLGRWYLHHKPMYPESDNRNGLDLTFGSYEAGKNTSTFETFDFGGILIRKIQSENEEDLNDYSGPAKITKELSKKLKEDFKKTNELNALCSDSLLKIMPISQHCSNIINKTGRQLPPVKNGTKNMIKKIEYFPKKYRYFNHTHLPEKFILEQEEVYPTIQ